MRSKKDSPAEVDSYGMPYHSSKVPMPPVKPPKEEGYGVDGLSHALAWLGCFEALQEDCRLGRAFFEAVIEKSGRP